MTTEAILNLSDPFFDSLAPPETISPAAQFLPEFVSLASLEEGHPHDSGVPSSSMQIPSNQPHTLQATQIIKYKDNTESQRLPNLAPRSASRGTPKASTAAPVDVVSSLLHAYPPIPSLSPLPFAGSTTTDADADDLELTSENNQPRPYPKRNPNRSYSSSLHLPRPAGDPDEAGKRKKHLERNRVAATKSRQKKRRETKQLQFRFQEVSRRKSVLEVEVKQLHKQLLSLKDSILMHSQCDDEAIHLYLKCIARRASENSSSSPAPTRQKDDEDNREHRVGCMSPLQDAVCKPPEVDLQQTVQCA
ncbi:hypothetical protein BDV10DRAFT_178841 [Aspergillus recurvatus]